MHYVIAVWMSAAVLALSSQAVTLGAVVTRLGADPDGLGDKAAHIAMMPVALQDRSGTGVAYTDLAAAGGPVLHLAYKPSNSAWMTRTVRLRRPARARSFQRIGDALVAAVQSNEDEGELYVLSRTGDEVGVVDGLLVSSLSGAIFVFQRSVPLSGASGVVQLARFDASTGTDTTIWPPRDPVRLRSFTDIVRSHFDSPQQAGAASSSADPGWLSVSYSQAAYRGDTDTLTFRVRIRARRGGAGMLNAVSESFDAVCPEVSVASDPCSAAGEHGSPGFE